MNEYYHSWLSSLLLQFILHKHRVSVQWLKLLWQWLIHTLLDPTDRNTRTLLCGPNLWTLTRPSDYMALPYHVLCSALMIMEQKKEGWKENTVLNTKTWWQIKDVMHIWAFSWKMLATNLIEFYPCLLYLMTEADRCNTTCTR